MEAILYIAIAQFVYGGMLAITRSKRRLSDYILFCWFVLMAIFMSLALLKNKYPDSYWASLQLFPFFFTFGPFLYLYVRTLTSQRPKLEFIDGIHLLPFVIFSVSAVTLDISVDEGVLVGEAFEWNKLPYSISSLISIFIYIPLTLKLLNVHKRNLLEYFSYTSQRISLDWIRAVVIGFIVTIALTLLSALVNVATQSPTLHPGYFLFLGFAVFAFAFSYYGTRQPAIFSPREDERFVDPLALEEEIATPDAEPEEPQEKYLRSSLTEEVAQQHLQALHSYLEREKPFLHRDLTLSDVAAALEIPPHHLTQAINAHLEKNFYTLVNEYRIEEVKRRLLDPKYAHLTVLSIAHDAGFNSKSSFNMTFKKYVGVTPSQFRREQ